MRIFCRAGRTGKGTMKAITIWQPWASLWAYGAKQFETRSWATSYRGPIAIHAAQRQPRAVMRELPVKTQQGIFDALYKYLDIQSGALAGLKTGAIIATAELVGCHKIVLHGGRGMPSDAPGWLETDHGIYEPDDQELLFGDWIPGRYALEIANVKILDEPIPAKGKQRLWDWDAARAGEGR